MRFDTDLIKSRLSCSDMLAMHGIEVNRKGRASCCFHDDNRPSMAVFDDHIHCYACGAHADVITLAEQFYSVSTAEAIRITAELSGTAPVSDTKDYAKRAEVAEGIAVRNAQDGQFATLSYLQGKAEAFREVLFWLQGFSSDDEDKPP